jgi:hypothetical protein
MQAFQEGRSCIRRANQRSRRAIRAALTVTLLAIGTASAAGFDEQAIGSSPGGWSSGVIWRWKDGSACYVARANALENNVSLYYTENGVRKTLKYVDAPVAANAWHTLRAEFSGATIRVLLDGKGYIELNDDHIAGPGAVGGVDEGGQRVRFRLSKHVQCCPIPFSNPL